MSLISYQILSRFLDPYQSLSTLIPLVVEETISFGNFKISSQAPDLLSHPTRSFNEHYSLIR